MLRPLAAAATAAIVVALAGPARAADLVAPTAPNGSLLTPAFTVSELTTTRFSADAEPIRPAWGMAERRPERPSILPAMYVSLIGLQAFDVYSTNQALRAGASEANPVMKGIVGNPAAFISLKAGVTTASILAAEHMWRRNDRVKAVVLMAVTNGMLAYVAHNNARVLASRR